jgi:hypothetical protein
LAYHANRHGTRPNPRKKVSLHGGAS